MNYHSFLAPVLGLLFSLGTFLMTVFLSSTAVNPSSACCFLGWRGFLSLLDRLPLPPLPPLGCFSSSTGAGLACSSWAGSAGFNPSGTTVSDSSGFESSYCCLRGPLCFLSFRGFFSFSSSSLGSVFSSVGYDAGSSLGASALVSFFCSFFSSFSSFSSFYFLTSLDRLILLKSSSANFAFNLSCRSLNVNPFLNSSAEP